MFEYQKMILEKVSFSKQLFIKEFEKSKQWLTKVEFKQLINWINDTFSPNPIKVAEVKPLALKA